MEKLDYTRGAATATMASNSSTSSSSADKPGGNNSTTITQSLEDERAKLAASMPSRNPMPLSASQEAQVRDIYYARVRNRCAEEIKGMLCLCAPGSSLLFSSPLLSSLLGKRFRYPIANPCVFVLVSSAFADCALGRTFTVAFYCKTPQRIMNNCMKIHATQEEQDAAREEWFAKRIERQKERERKARRKAEQEAFLREWWGLPEKDREEARREMEKLKQAERVGGFPATNRRPLSGTSGSTTSNDSKEGSGGR